MLHFSPFTTHGGISCVKHVTKRRHVKTNLKTYDERCGGFVGTREALEGWFEVRGGRLRKQVVLMVINE